MADHLQVVAVLLQELGLCDCQALEFGQPRQIEQVFSADVANVQSDERRGDGRNGGRQLALFQLELSQRRPLDIEPAGEINARIGFSTNMQRNQVVPVGQPCAF